MTQLDKHGARILAFIERYQQRFGRSPSYKEIGAGVGISSTDHVSRDLKKLQRQGYLAITPRVGRSIVLLKTKHRRQHSRRVHLPLLRHMQPEQPFAARNESAGLDWQTIGRELVQGEHDALVLRVQGDSMVDALVNDGDLVILKPRNSARNGEMVAVWIKPDEALSLKYYYRENGHVRLVPANPALPPVQLPPSQVEVKGQVLAIVRKAAAAE